MTPFKKKTSKSVVIILLFLITSSYGFLSNIQRDTRREVDNRREIRLQDNRDDSSFRTLNFGQQITEKDTVMDNLFDRRSFRTGPLSRDSRITERRVTDSNRRSTEETGRDASVQSRDRVSNNDRTRNHHLNNRDANNNLEINIFRDNNRRSTTIRDRRQNSASSLREQNIRQDSFVRRVRSRQNRSDRREESIRTYRKDSPSVSLREDKTTSRQENFVGTDLTNRDLVRSNSIRNDRSDLARSTSRQEDSIRESRNDVRQDSIREDRSDLSRLSSRQEDRRDSATKDQLRLNSRQEDRSRDLSRLNSRRENSFRTDRDSTTDRLRVASRQEDRRESARDLSRFMSRQEDTVRGDRRDIRLSRREDSIRTDRRDLSRQDSAREDRRDSAIRDLQDTSRRDSVRTDRRDSARRDLSQDESVREDRRESTIRDLRLTPLTSRLDSMRRSASRMNRSLRIRNGRMLSSFDSARSRSSDRAIRIREQRDFQHSRLLSRARSFTERDVREQNIQTENVRNQQRHLSTRNHERENRIETRLTRDPNDRRIRLADNKILSRQDRLDNNEQNNRRMRLVLQNRRETYRRFRSVEHREPSKESERIDTRTQSSDFETFSKRPLDLVTNTRAVKESLSSTNNFDIVRSVDVTKKLREEAIEFTSGLDTWANTIKIILCIYLIGQMFASSSTKNKLRFQNMISPMNFIKEKVQ